MNQEKFEQIIAKLRQEESRWDAILELKGVHDPIWVGPMIALLKDDDWVVRWSVAETLGDLGDPAAIESLLEILNDQDYHVFKNAYKSLERFGLQIVPFALPYFEHENHKVRQAVFSLLLALGDDAVPRLEAELPKYNWIVANRILHVIWNISGKASEEFLIQSISNSKVRKNAVVMLGMLGSKRALTHMINVYDEPCMRRVVLIAMKLIGKKIAFPVILNSLNHAAYAPKAEAIILKIKNPFLPYLVQALTHTGYSKEDLIRLIIKIGPEPVMPKIHQLAERSADLRLITSSLREKYPLVDEKTNKGLFGFLKG